MLDLASTQEYHIPDLRSLLINTENTELLLSPCVLAFVPFVIMLNMVLPISYTLLLCVCDASWDSPPPFFWHR